MLCVMQPAPLPQPWIVCYNNTWDLIWFFWMKVYPIQTVSALMPVSCAKDLLWAYLMCVLCSLKNDVFVYWKNHVFGRIVFKERQSISPSKKTEKCFQYKSYQDLVIYMFHFHNPNSNVLHMLFVLKCWMSNFLVNLA